MSSSNFASFNLQTELRHFHKSNKNEGSHTCAYFAIDANTNMRQTVSRKSERDVERTGPSRGLQSHFYDFHTGGRTEIFSCRCQHSPKQRDIYRTAIAEHMSQFFFITRDVGTMESQAEAVRVANELREQACHAKYIKYKNNPATTVISSQLWYTIKTSCSNIFQCFNAHLPGKWSQTGRACAPGTEAFHAAQVSWWKLLNETAAPRTCGMKYANAQS